MKNKYDENDDINFEIKNYKFNPVFIDKKNDGKKEKSKKDQKNYEYIQNKKIYDNQIPLMTDSISFPNNTMGAVGAVPTLNKQKTNTQPIPSAFSDKDHHLLSLKQEDINTLRNNYKEKVSLIEQDYNKKILKMEENNKKLIDSIKELYNNKLTEMKNQMEQNLNKLNKQNLDLLNEMRTLRTNSIPLQEHYEKLNDLNNKWEEKFKNYKKNYENKYKQISTKIENELPLDKIFAEINTSLTPENLLKMIKLIELRNKIGYYTFILNLQEKYNDDYEQFDDINKEKLRNLKKYTIQRFDDIIKDDGKIDKTFIKKNSDNLSRFDGDKTYLKKSEIVNYESFLRNENDRSGINNIDGNYNNNLSVSKSISIAQDKFSSDLESFNFSNDTIPNKDIQVLTPPELIK